MWDPAYIREDDWLFQRYELSSGNVLRFMAQDIRKAATGVHAKVCVVMNSVTLAWTSFNVERDEDRVRLANSAYSHLDGEGHALDRVEFPKNLMKHSLDLFCLGLWRETVSVDVGGILEGDPDIMPAHRMLGDYVLRDAGSIMFGQPGAGKSNTALAMADSLMWGIDQVWPVHDAAIPLYINVERSAASMSGRLARINRALGLEPRVGFPFLNARGKSLSDIYEAAKQTIKQEGCTVVFYDSLSRAGFGSLVKDDVANQAMDMLNALGTTWVALAHSPRGDETHAFGSQMFDAAADLTVHLKSQTTRNGYSTGIGLEVMKANDIRKPPMAVHVLEWDDDGLCGIRRARHGEFVELEAGEKKGREEQARQYLLSVGEATAVDVADAIGWARNHTSSLLSAAAWATRTIKARKVYYAVRTDYVEAQA